MEPPTPSPPGDPILDEERYRAEVLRLSAEAEQARAQQLSNEAHELGLRIPDIEVSAPLAASIASGVVDLSSPIVSSGSSTDRNSICGGTVTPSHEPSSPVSSPLDQVVSSLSDITLSSERAKPGSTRSLASLSTRPTSYCSSDSRTVTSGQGNANDGVATNSNRTSMLSVGSGDKKEKRRSSLKSAIGRIHFRKKRPSSVILPTNAQVSVAKGEAGVERIYLERKREPAANDDQSPQSPGTAGSNPRLEIPIFDKEALQRSLDDPELSEMLERHRMERNRHLAFQDAALGILRRRHQTAVSERQSEHQRLEDEKREKVRLVLLWLHDLFLTRFVLQNITDAIRMEERQLAVEVEQQREFERAKLNSRTRIKHMEGYFRNASPPPSPAVAAQQSSESLPGTGTSPPARRFTRQQKEQLEQQYHDHESMDALHEARIKVLRDRQEIRLQEAIARMERELDTMCERHSKAVADLQAEHRTEEASLLQALDSKKTALRQRWYLEEAVLRRQLEMRHGHSYGPLPPISFSEASPENRDSAICVSESLPGAGTSK